ncbi:polymeric immunoglobulin receptor-like [Megalops cyprinoides]|uniref:polymeric immunoglobulin receptor-like n=1 Tax=Megalops cyprinoides TaxID=118141 RepID=UPI001864B9A0|nr:polymeric immunoglobulin receptor-like [Megalops cyprinoides]
MAPLLFLLLFLSKVQPGVQSVKTVSKLSVQRGHSVTIPCLYNQEYRDHVKYWCKGEQWNHCTTVVRTDFPQRAGYVSITDSPAQKLFTVTMSYLQEGDSDYYWCGVEIDWAVDDGAYLHLTVTKGLAGLSVWNNMVVGEEGGRLSIQYRYGDSLRYSEKKWCRILDQSSCLTAGRTQTSQHASVLVSDDRRGVLTVTVRRLERKDTGWYWCTAGEEQFPVHITVTPPKPPTQRPTTTTTTSTSRKQKVLPSTTQQTAALTLGLCTDDTCIPSVTEENSNHRTVSSVILHVLLKSAVALVYITCTIIAALKIWTYCKQIRGGASESD